MKRSVAWILAIALFIIIAAGGAALMYLSPRGVLNPSSPEAAMQTALDTAAYDWHDEFTKLYTAEVTAFEDADTVTESIYASLAGNETFTFREWKGVSAGNEPVFILSGSGDFLTVKLQYINNMWTPVELAVPDGLFAVETNTVTVTVPSDATVYINGIALDSSHIVNDFVAYTDLTELEARFENVPHRVCYEISGLYCAPTVEVERESGVALEGSDGLNWSYMPPDAAAHTFSVQAPADAVVTVNGTQLTASDSSEETPYIPLVDVPEELKAQLPSLTLYEAKGLYSVPEISAVDAAGNALEATVNPDGTLVYTAGNDEALSNAHSGTVEAFINNIAEYGSAHLEWTAPASFVKKDTPLFEYFAGARYSLGWIGTVRLHYDSITSYDYMPLGDNAFLCKGRLICTSSTYYQTVDMDLEYEMLWENTGSAWQVADMAFTDNYSREVVS